MHGRSHVGALLSDDVKNKSLDYVMATNKLVNRNQTPKKRRWIKANDLLILVSLGIGTLASIILPPAVWMQLCRKTAKILPLSFFKLATIQKIASGLTISQTAASFVIRETLAARLIAVFTFLRARCLGPKLEIKIEGKEHLDNARSQGRGVILWIADLVFAGDVTKIALADHGYSVSHLSRPEHGFSDSCFGLKFLNPVRQKFELRYLRERIIYRREQPDEAGILIRQRLRENGIVSISASGYEGRVIVDADFLNGRQCLASGAPRLAFKENCPILPVFVRPSSDARSFTVVVAEPLNMASCDKNQAVLEATAEFLDRLAPFVMAKPELWRGWPSFLSSNSATRQANAMGSGESQVSAATTMPIAVN